MSDILTPVLELTRNATGNVQGARFVSFNGSQVSTLDAKVFGIARNDAEHGEDFTAGVIGVFTVEAGAEIAEGKDVISDASGRAVQAPDDATNVVGIAMSAPKGPGYFVQVLKK